MAGEPTTETTTTETTSADTSGSATADGPRDVLARIEVLTEELHRATLELVDIAGPTGGLVSAPPVAEGLVGQVQLDRWAVEMAQAAGVLSGVSERLSVVAAQALVDTSAHRRDGSSTPARWIERHLGLTRHDAQRLVRCGEVLRHLDDTRLTFHTDELRLAHVDAIARIVPARLSDVDQAVAWDAVADSQGDLIHAASHLGPTAFARFCRRVRDSLDFDGPPDRAGAPSRLWLSESFEGRWALSGDLTADDGALLATWLDRKRRAVLQRHRDASDTSTSDRTPLSEIDAEAFLELVRDGAGTDRPGRIGLYLHADLVDLSRLLGDDVPTHAAHTDANLDISTETLWALLADAEVTPVFWDTGQPLSYGRSRRLAPEVLRQVLAHRDRTCRFVGCEMPSSRCDVHHTTEWDRGGRTDPENTANTCRFHHGGHHRGDWTIGYDASRDEAYATFRDGQPVDPTPRWRRHRRRRTGSDSAHLAWMTQLAERLASRGVHLRV